mgnify:FL=1
MTEIKEIEKQLDTSEKQRQLYVAMTRAQDRLILSGAYDSGSRSKSETWFSSLRNILQDYDQFLLKEYKAAEVKPAVSAAATADTILVSGELLQRIQPLPEYGLAWQRSLSATALQTYLYCPRCYYYQYILQMPGYEIQKEAGAEGYLPASLQGEVIHKALELLVHGYEPQQAFTAALQAYKVQGSADRAHEIYWHYLNGPLYQKLQQKERKAEISFSLPLLREYGVDAAFTGYIDCTVFNGDGTLTIIDYQLALYKKAAAELWQQPVKMAELHFLQNNSCWQLSVHSDVLAEAADLCKEIFAKRTECEFAVKNKYCQNCQFAYFCPKHE